MRGLYVSITNLLYRDPKWVQRHLKGIEIHKEELAPDEVIIVMDTTYFKRFFGVMVWRCPHRKKSLLWKFLPYETIAAYKRGIEELEEKGWKVLAIVCDGRRGVLQGFSVPVQMCHFHQAAIKPSIRWSSLVELMGN